MKHKSILKLVAILMVVGMILTGCSKGGSSSASDANMPESSATEPMGEKAMLKVTALKGPTAMGLVKVMEDNANGTAKNNYTFTLAGAPDELTSKIINGEIDIASVPTNLAAVLYNKTEGKISTLAINTLGILYILENGNTIKTVADLKGKTIYATGQGSTPEYALNLILEKNGLKVGTDVNVEYLAEHTELATMMASGKADIALLPEPFVTSVMAQNEDIRVALDITKEWDAATDSSSALTMTVTVVRNEVLEKNKAAVDAFMDEYKASVEFTNTKVDEASALIEKYDIMKAAVAMNAIPKCNIVFIEGTEMKAKAEGFFGVLQAANPKSLGGKIPDDAFYYQR